MKFEQFEKYEPGFSGNVYAFVCEDRLWADESKAVWNRIFGGEWDFVKVSAREFDAIEPSQLTQWALSPPLFGPSRAFLVTDAGKILKKRLRDMEAVHQISPSSLKVVLLFDSRPQLGRNSVSFPVVEVDRLRPGDAVRWLRRRHRASAEVARYLVENLGVELQLLDLEMEKLRLYVGESRPVELRDVDELTFRSEQFGPFDLDDALLDRDHPRSVRIADAMLEEGVEPLLLLSRITRVWRQIFLGKVLGGTASRKAMAQAAGVPHWKAGRFAEGCARFSLESVVLGFQELLSADRAFKTSSPDPTCYFDLLLWRLIR